MTENNVLLRVENLVKHFPITQGIIVRRQIGAVHAVDGLSFEIKGGETFGLVGESGCGKSTTGRTVLQLYRPTAGSVTFEGTELSTLKGEPLRKMRRRMQMIFQDPYASLNPRMTVGEIIGEPLIIHGMATPKEANERVKELLKLPVTLSFRIAGSWPSGRAARPSKSSSTSIALNVIPSHGVLPRSSSEANACAPRFKSSMRFPRVRACGSQRVTRSRVCRRSCDAGSPWGRFSSICRQPPTAIRFRLKRNQAACNKITRAACRPRFDPNFLSVINPVFIQLLQISKVSINRTKAPNRL